MEKMLSSLHNHQVERRSTDGPTDVDVEEIFRKPVDCLKMDIMSAWQRLLKQLTFFSSLITCLYLDLK